MNVRAASYIPTNNKINNKNRAAKNGALLTSGVLATSTAISWVKRPQEMKKVVAKNGGFGKYSLHYAVSLLALSTLGALINVGLNSISEKINPKHPPKAAN